ncbi:TolC family protein [Stieleria sp. JC731]|uniref:TolC family protein n=1 Tax=Pirellulaceae TaxID=2691357 RepID=UPI001E629499|nr:TolC family protein [Stieleria sp. JC731]MCC9600428.1 TolC family protein [Stieleria sp. JC731]
MKSKFTLAVTGGLVCLASGCGITRPSLKPSVLETPVAAKPTTNDNVSAKTKSPAASVQLAGFSETPSDTVLLGDLLAQHSDASADSSAVAAEPYIASEPLVASDGAATLEELLAIAFGNNPAINELAATTQKAAGYRTQVALYANPIVGYQGQQLADKGTEQHLLFIDQEIVTGGKLQLNCAVLNEALRAQLQELEAQKMRVATDIKTVYFDCMLIQQQLQLIEAFAQQLDRGVELANQRFAVGEGTRIDALQTKVQLNQLQLTSQQKAATLQARYRELAALCGTPNRSITSVSGDNLPLAPESIDWNSMATTIVASSPEYAAAHARIRQASAAVRRHEAQPIPNLLVQMGTGVDNSTGGHGMLNIQAGAPLPLFNKNQGNIAAARAEYCRAVQEAERIENAIRARLAEASGEYDRAAKAVQMYANELLPAAQQSLDLAEEAYQAGEQDFIQLLVTRRTYFDTNLAYVESRGDLAIAKAKIDGYLLSGALNAVFDGSGDDSLRGLTFSQQ